MKNRNKQTKFPVARIKKIMQKDEEVGKVAQATPVVISKALELFLGMLVDEAAKVTLERNSKRVESYHLDSVAKALELFLGMLVDEAAKVTLERNSKRVESYHLKHAIDRTDMLDFLKEIVDGVPDPSAGGTIDIEAEKNEAKKRRGQGTGGGRKRRKKGELAAGEVGDDSFVNHGNGNGGWIMEQSAATGAGTDGEDGGGGSEHDWD
ncbi:histone-fold-containing protein [Sanghuangporus baumii]|uniref:Histone-fold-containing protein n=1 Tax=Sanghuangporus baumii TaxID=108892 RepID=A0A9Q5N8F7_SANBA|nr:histone-fold-containing protein [Sanghuangporus baumii]